MSAAAPDPRLFACGGHLPEAVHTYENAHGVPVGAVARFPAGTLDAKRKAFFQYRLEGNRWLPGLNGRKLPLYHAAELLSALKGGVTLWIAEGEQCVEALRALGLPATTNPGGAKQWRTDHSEAVRGGDLVVLVDDDAIGREHGQMVAASCHGLAQRVRVLDLAAVLGRVKNDGWDVADWIAEGGTAAELLRLAAATPDWSPPQADNSEWPEPGAFLTSSEPDPFPLHDAMPPQLAAFAQAVADVVRVDVTGPATFMTAVLSAAAGNAYCVWASASHYERNLARYVLWSKPSGERGSATFRYVVEPLDAWMESALSENERARATADADATLFRKRAEQLEGQAAKEKDPAKFERIRQEARDVRSRISPPPPRPIAYVGDTTSEALVRFMHEQGGATALFSADARIAADEILGRYIRDGKTDDSPYLKAHAGDVIDRNRVGPKSQGEMLRIPWPSLAVAICMQPDKFEEFAGRKALLASGLIPRCNVITPRSLVGTRIETGEEQPLDPALAAGWRTWVRAIREARARIVAAAEGGEFRPVELRLDPEAMVLRREFANALEVRQRPGGDLHEVAAFASKAAGEAVRLAGLFHLAILAAEGRVEAAGQIPIPASTWRLAQAHQRWQLSETLRSVSLALEDETERRGHRLLLWFVRHTKPGVAVPMRDILGSRIFKDSADALLGLRWLEERGWAREQPAEGDQRTARWLVHPKAWGGA